VTTARSALDCKALPRCSCQLVGHLLPPAPPTPHPDLQAGHPHPSGKKASTSITATLDVTPLQPPLPPPPRRHSKPSPLQPPPCRAPVGQSAAPAPGSA
jgi:hypothetical protein